MEHSDVQPFEDTVVMTDIADIDACADEAEMPCSLTGILEPDAALAAARRMQRWYQSTPQGVAHSLFGRDGRRVEGRLEVDYVEGAPREF